MPVVTADFGDRLGVITGAESLGGEFWPVPEGLSGRMFREGPALPDNAIADSISFGIFARAGHELTEGSYQQAWPSGSETVPTLRVGIDAMSCEGPGSFVVSDVALDTGGNVSRLAASYSTTCFGQQVAGEIRWRSEEPFTAATISPGSIDFGPVVPGTSSEVQRLTLRNAGSAPLPVQFVTLEGSDTFSVDDDCGGATITVGGTCVVDVLFTPVVPGPRAATLSIWDGTFRGRRSIELRGTTPQETIPPGGTG
ncbi:MAG: choice-of-anchor D domain-containing protein, partial [Acidimicrobiia bacterium]